MKILPSQSMFAGCVALIFLSSAWATASVTQQKREVPSERAVKIMRDEPLLKVRSRIIKQGWIPVRMHANDGHMYDGAEKRLADQKILEVDACSIDAGANCVFYYRRRQQCLRIDTVGEQVRDMKVTRWTTECPSGDQGQ